MQQENQDLLNGAAYEAPKCETIEVQNEGVLCQSMNVEHGGFVSGDEVRW